MAIKEFFRKLSYEVKRREDTKSFVKSEFYFPDEADKAELEVGESHVSVELKPEK